MTTPHVTQHATRNTQSVFRIAYSVSPADWNSALSSLPHPHVLQSWEWGEFKSRHGWHPARYLWYDGNRPCAAASVLTRRLGHWPVSVMYVPKGPALDYGEGGLFERVLADLEESAQRARALFIKIDPDVRIEKTAVVEALRHRGWVPSGEQVQFRNTVLIDLTLTPEERLAAMHQKTRYNVRLAERKGVTVREGTLADLPLLYWMYAETAARDGFVIRPEMYYHDAWGTFIEAGLAQPLIAEVAGEPVAMVIIFRFADRAWYMYGASRSIHREKMPNHLLQWEAMQWAHAQGCTVYDMWGAPDELNESDPLWGVYRFKEGFGGEFVQHIGAWDFPVSRLGYWLYSVVMPRMLDAMRRVYWRRNTSAADPVPAETKTFNG